MLAIAIGASQQGLAPGVASLYSGHASHHLHLGDPDNLVPRERGVWIRAFLQMNRPHRYDIWHRFGWNQLEVRRRDTVVSQLDEPGSFDPVICRSDLSIVGHGCILSTG